MIQKVNIRNYTQIQQQNNNKKTQNIEKNEKISRVEEVKKAIENGTYKIDIKATAKAMAKALIK